MNVQPLSDRILVRRVEEQETIRGGIIIPDTAKEKPQEGEVVAVEPQRAQAAGDALDRRAQDLKGCHEDEPGDGHAHRREIRHHDVAEAGHPSTLRRLSHA